VIVCDNCRAQDHRIFGFNLALGRAPKAESITVKYSVKHGRRDRC
jgi:hypothetical protein